MDDPLPLDGLGPSRKRCSMCKRWLPLDAFHRNGHRRDGLQTRCRECNIETNKRWYRQHPEARVDRMDDYARRRREDSHRRVLEYLREHPCVDCGEVDPVVLEFDHLRDKVRNISAMASASQPWEKIEAEIAKCEVVCANCHRRRTAGASTASATGTAGPSESVGAVGLEPTTCSLKVSCADHCATPPEQRYRRAAPRPGRLSRR